MAQHPLNAMILDFATGKPEPESCQCCGTCELTASRFTCGLDGTSTGEPIRCVGCPIVRHWCCWRTGQNQVGGMVASAFGGRRSVWRFGPLPSTHPSTPRYLLCVVSPSTTPPTSPLVCPRFLKALCTCLPGLRCCRRLGNATVLLEHMYQCRGYRRTVLWVIDCVVGPAWPSALVAAALAHGVVLFCWRLLGLDSSSGGALYPPWLASIFALVYALSLLLYLRVACFDPGFVRRYHEPPVGGA